MDTKHSEHLEEAVAAIPSGRRFWQYARCPIDPGCGAAPSASATGVGSCGDRIRVDVYVVNDMLEKVQCVPQGCVYTQACANAMRELATGRTVEQALSLQPEDVADELEGLPDDHLHCARLAVNTLGNAIADYYRKQYAADRNKGDSLPLADGKD